jgi:hypothetical protein
MSLAILNQPCSSRFASSLVISLQLSRQRRAFVSTANRRDDKNAQPQTAATESIELSSVSWSFDQADGSQRHISLNRMIHGSIYLMRIGKLVIPVRRLELMARLLRNTPRNQPVLFIYRNTPCVVIGRNQVSLPSTFRLNADKAESMERDHPP